MTAEQEQEGTPSPQAVLTVAAVARRLGVAPSTLRTWDRRYGLGPSAHTAGSHRRYDQDDVSRLIVMRGLVMEGVPAAEAAQIALGTPAAAPVARLNLPETATNARAARDTRAEAPGSDVDPDVDPDVDSDVDPDGELLVAPWAAPWPGPARSAHPAASRFGGAAAGVPVSRSAPVPGGVPTRGRAVWPATPLAAEHLLQSAAAAATAPAPAEHIHGDPLDDAPDAPDAGLDAALAQVIEEAFGRQSPGAPAPLGWAALPVGRAALPMGRAGGGRVLSLPDASPRARGLARAAMTLDTHELGRLMRDAVASYGVIRTWDTMVLPVLRGLGDRWQATGEGVDVEHAFSEATMGVLRGIAAGLHRPRNVRPVLLACADGDHHSLPLHVLAAALAEIGVGCRVLGVGLPGRSLAAATRRTGPAAVFVYARMPVADATLLREFPRQRPAPRVLIGGPGWQYVEVPGTVARVESLQGAVDEVRSAVPV